MHSSGVSPAHALRPRADSPAPGHRKIKWPEHALGCPRCRSRCIGGSTLSLRRRQSCPRAWRRRPITWRNDRSQHIRQLCARGHRSLRTPASTGKTLSRCGGLRSIHNLFYVCGRAGRARRVATVRFCLHLLFGKQLGRSDCGRVWGKSSRRAALPCEALRRRWQRPFPRLQLTGSRSRLGSNLKSRSVDPHA